MSLSLFSANQMFQFLAKILKLFTTSKNISLSRYYQSQQRELQDPRPNLFS